MEREHERHVPVLLREAVDALALKEGACVIDATLGAGGHFAKILDIVGEKGCVLGIDADEMAIASARTRFAERPHAHFAVGNFRAIEHIAEREGLQKVDAILADLGWRMEQFSADTSRGGGKGFSFQHDEPLLMTFGAPNDYPFTARDVVNEWSEEAIANVLYAYGDERHARRIARALVTAREQSAIETSGELAHLIEKAVPRRGKVHPATKSFQALRIAVNDELDALSEFIEGAFRLLTTGGRLALITFHSIEDRIAKHAFRELEEAGRVRRITKKPITPSIAEIRENPRARSAHLRIIEKTDLP